MLRRVNVFSVSIIIHTLNSFYFDSADRISNDRRRYMRGIYERKREKEVRCCERRTEIEREKRLCVR